MSRKSDIFAGLAGFLAVMFIGGASLVCAQSELPAAKVLNFPPDRSLGIIMILDVNKPHRTNPFAFGGDNSNWEDADYLCEAKGQVMIPAGRRVGIYISEKALKDLSPLQELPPDAFYMLSLPYQSAGDACMPYITHLTGLKELKLTGVKITSAAMRYITKLQSLEELSLPNDTTDAGFRHVGQLTSLKRLFFYGERITNKGLQPLSKLTALERLAIGGKCVDDDCLAYLADMKSLQYLSLMGENFSDKGLVQVKALPALRILNLTHVPITDEGLRNLSGHPSLENLGLFNTRITNKGLVYLESLPSLKKLNIGNMNNDLKNPPVSDDGMVHIAKLQKLEYLDLPNTGISDKGLVDVAKLRNLKHLWVCGSSNSPLTDKALQHVSSMTNLEFLLIHGTGFTDEGMGCLAKLSYLRELHLCGNSITDAGLAKLKTLQSLEKLKLVSENITMSGLSHLNAMTQMSDLYLHGVAQDDSGMDISGLRNLEKLTLTLKKTRKGKIRIQGELRDEDLACLANLKHLKWLHIGNIPKTRITDAGMAHLAGLTNMEQLGIGSPYLTDKSLTYLRNMKRMQRMTIAGNFTDEGLKYLENLRDLVNLTIYSSNNFSSAAIDSLKDKLPNIRTLTAEKDRELKNPSKDQADSKYPGEGEHAPAINVKTIDGKALNLSDYKGKVVVLYFWGTWCSPCVRGTPKLKELYADMKASFGDDFEMISVSMDDNEQKVRNHVDKYELTWPQARIGLHSRISAEYGVNDTAPHSFLIGPDGKIRLTPDSPQVDTKSFIKELLAQRDKSQ